MGRWADQDSDEHRLPEGMKRIGYDADTQIYTFRDASGAIYESESGNRYGELWPAGRRPQRTPSEIEHHNAQLKKSNRESVKMILPFALLVLVFLLLLFRYLGNAGAHADLGEQAKCAEGDTWVQVVEKDTCFDIGKKNGLGVEELLGIEGNEGVDCDHLRIGQKICVPK
ncbi:carbohydrate-binding module family 50 protein [Lentithecium fluviatile CBS 122367]|uniref:Carbohydrate-binding module family 50 protein n=1 Tax=Lentithecium fluviatile CBS 122367 TaxID=1168545 RepID=A0A6G1IQY6_9PLEO|nr:carbohydrate-binding module family 50 protein [Lentithecium fluviatile CBS 122367]